MFYDPMGMSRKRSGLAQLAVLRIGDGLQPLVGAVLAGHLDSDVAEPGVLLGPVPVLDPGGDDDDGAGRQAHRLPARLLIPALAGGADEQLAAAPGGMMNVPVVAAARLEGYIGGEQAAFRGSQRIEEGFADEIARKGGVGRARAEYALAFKLSMIHGLHSAKSPFKALMLRRARLDKRRRGRYDRVMGLNLDDSL